MSDIDEHKAFLVDLVRKAWVDETGVLLSQAGAAFTLKYGKLSDLYSVSLKAFIRSEMVGVLKVVPHPQINSKEIVLLSDVPFEGMRVDEQVALFPRREVSELVRYPVGLWTAFKHPLAVGQRRWVPLFTPQHYRDLDASVGGLDGAIEIPAEQVVGRFGEAVVSDREVMSAITGYLADKPDVKARMAEAVAMVGAVRQTGREIVAASDAVAALDVLGRFIPRQDAARIMVPLDVVMDLVSRIAMGNAR